MQKVHLSSDELEAYSLGSPSETDLDNIEEHLLFCERCQNELALTHRFVGAMKEAIASLRTVKRLRSMHFTKDGPIFGAMYCGADGKWVVRNWGRQLAGLRICDSLEEANAYLVDSFRQMFPEHFCSEKCREEFL